MTAWSPSRMLRATPLVLPACRTHVGRSPPGPRSDADTEEKSFGIMANRGRPAVAPYPHICAGSGDSAMKRSSGTRAPLPGNTIGWFEVAPVLPRRTSMVAPERHREAPGSLHWP